MILIFLPVETNLKNIDYPFFSLKKIGWLMILQQTSHKLTFGLIFSALRMASNPLLKGPK